MTLAQRIIAKATQRVPDFVLGADNPEGPYLNRWWLIPRNRWFNVYLHQFLRSDDDRAHHCHPWAFNFSVMLRGAYTEHTIERGGLLRRVVRKAGEWKLRLWAAPHRLELLQDPFAETAHELPCWTLFITGPRVREWGFYCMERGWIPWQRFTAPHDSGSIGPGCDA